MNPPPFGKRRTFWLLLLVGIALAPTHELSPYMAAGALLVLAIFRTGAVLDVPAVGLPALAWAGTRAQDDRKNFTFGALFTSPTSGRR